MLDKLPTDDEVMVCDLCHGKVVLICCPGRMIQCGQGRECEIPENLPIATCVTCGETYFNLSECLALADAVDSTMSENQ